MQHLQEMGVTSFKPNTFSLSSPRSPVPASRLPYALPSSVSRNLFVCHSCENCRVCTNNSHSGTRPVCSPTPFPYPLSSFNCAPGGILWVALRTASTSISTPPPPSSLECLTPCCPISPRNSPTPPLSTRPARKPAPPSKRPANKSPP